MFDIYINGGKLYSKKQRVLCQIFGFFISKKFSWENIFATQTNIRYKQVKPVLVFYLWNVLKQIVCPWNPLVLFVYDLSTSVTNQSSLLKHFEHGVKGIWFFYITLWRISSVSPHEYLLVIDTYFHKQKNIVTSGVKAKRHINQSNRGKKSEKYVNNSRSLFIEAEDHR